MTLIIRHATEGDDPAWDAFVYAHPQGTFFHRAAWRIVLQEVFGFASYYLLAERAGQIAGLLPLAHQRSLLFGSALISLPFCVEGGPLASDAEAGSALYSAAIDLADRIGARYVELRTRTAGQVGWTAKRGLYATFAKDLLPTDDENLVEIPRKQRAVVRKTLTSGLVSQIDHSAERLFNVYSQSVRNLGTPMFPRHYFPTLLRVFAGDCDIVVILDRGSPVSAVMNFYYKGCVMPYYGGGTKAARDCGANDFLYWEVMRRAVPRGCRRFDFGRSKANTGAFAFKKNWGFAPDWLEYQYWLAPGTSLPDKNPLNPKYALLIAAWKRLPIPVANALGPLLITGLG